METHFSFKNRVAEGKWIETDNGKQNSKKNYPYRQTNRFQVKKVHKKGSLFNDKWVNSSRR